MPVFSFDVTVSTHALLQQGVCEARMLNGSNWHRIVVAADTYEEAFLEAGQMASCVELTQLHGRRVRISSDAARATAEAAGRRIGVEPEDEGSVMCTGAYLRI